MTSLLHNYDILTEETVLITETPKHTAFVGINVSQSTDTQYLLCLFPRLLKLLVKQMAPEEVYISSVPNVKEGEGEEQRIKKSQRLVLPQKKKNKKKKNCRSRCGAWHVKGQRGASDLKSNPGVRRRAKEPNMISN